jgi:DNA-binding transcriptional MerR regulator
MGKQSMSKTGTIGPAHSSREPAPPREPEPASAEYIQIGELAERTGLTQRTLRYYEEVGLLTAPSRMTGGFRLYSPEDVARVEQVKQLKQVLGFSLAEIRTIVETQQHLNVLRSQYQSDPDVQHRRDVLDNAEAIVRRQLAVIEQKIDQMNTMRAELVERLHRYDTLREKLRDTLPEAPGAAIPVSE